MINSRKEVAYRMGKRLRFVHLGSDILPLLSSSWHGGNSITLGRNKYFTGDVARA